jgi:hypothetical protein
VPIIKKPIQTKTVEQNHFLTLYEEDLEETTMTSGPKNKNNTEATFFYCLSAKNFLFNFLHTE